jgi:hypothetical protein
LKRFYLIVEQMVDCEFKSVAGYVEKKQDANKEMNDGRKLFYQ